MQDLETCLPIKRDFSYFLLLPPQNKIQLHAVNIFFLLFKADLICLMVLVED